VGKQCCRGNRKSRLPVGDRQSPPDRLGCRLIKSEPQSYSGEFCEAG
jgi:hypothetical protein